MKNKLLSVLLLLMLGGCGSTNNIGFVNQKITITEYDKMTAIEGNCTTSIVDSTFNVTCINENGEVAAIHEYDINNMLLPVQFESSEQDEYYYEIIRK